MAGTGKYLDVIDGVPTQRRAVETSTGAGDAGEIPKLNATGKLDESVMPTGIGADTAAILASETLVAGNFVNIWLDGGIAKVRKADASTSGKEANGFVIAPFNALQLATVYFEGKNDVLSGLTIGSNLYLSAITAGTATATPPSGSGNVVQRIGKAIAATSMSFEPAQSIKLA